MGARSRLFAQIDNPALAPAARIIWKVGHPLTGNEVLIAGKNGITYHLQDWRSSRGPSGILRLI